MFMLLKHRPHMSIVIVFFVIFFGVAAHANVAEAPDQQVAPEANAPEANAPEANAPEANAPEANAPEANAPEANAPEANAPEADQIIAKRLKSARHLLELLCVCGWGAIANVVTFLIQAKSHSNNRIKSVCSCASCFAMLITVAGFLFFVPLLFEGGLTIVILCHCIVLWNEFAAETSEVAEHVAPPTIH